MLVLLPPSEGKAEGGQEGPLELASLSLPALTPARETVLEELVALCRADEEKAREVLGLSEGLRGEIAKNAGLFTAPTRPAGELYTGVLYDALDLGGLSAAAARRAARSLLVFSALWGAVGTGDRIPSYRLSGGVKLPGTGPLGRYWRGPLESALPQAAGEGLVLDLRSSAYAAMWKPKGDTARRTATVRVLQSKTVDGVEKRSVVSHFNKATKGRLVRALLEEGAEPRTPQELADALRDLGYVVEGPQGEPRPGASSALDVVVTEL
ncbi:peroxide stress protein YaaA [Streptomyces tubbatahanensis]|uniref:Peroxide stress protein YaaA n=1 Tax=Streptomyces tubbatahanensis TaxID=2923272 RepID=A0ABY3XQS7_9ACTN|nr:peroxide stress protein YaaA [Streptomyces tubbatahanensis]UNS96797.1 peroxide stress protein YaaA [Streptomyces tubbatahanensis]